MQDMERNRTNILDRLVRRWTTVSSFGHHVLCTLFLNWRATDKDDKEVKMQAM